MSCLVWWCVGAPASRVETLVDCGAGGPPKARARGESSVLLRGPYSTRRGLRLIIAGDSLSWRTAAASRPSRCSALLDLRASNLLLRPIWLANSSDGVWPPRFRHVRAAFDGGEPLEWPARAPQLAHPWRSRRARLLTDSVPSRFAFHGIGEQAAGPGRRSLAPWRTTGMHVPSPPSASPTPSSALEFDRLASQLECCRRACPSARSSQVRRVDTLQRAGISVDGWKSTSNEAQSESWVRSPVNSPWIGRTSAATDGAACR